MVEKSQQIHKKLVIPKEEPEQVSLLSITTYIA